MSNTYVYPPPPSPAGGMDDLDQAVLVVGIVVGISVLSCIVCFAYWRHYHQGANQRMIQSQLTTSGTQNLDAPPSAASEEKTAMLGITEDEEAPAGGGEPAPETAPLAPAPDGRVSPQTMDQALQARAAAKIQAAKRGQVAREQRQQYLKAGGRPNATDFDNWRTNSMVEASGPVRLHHHLRQARMESQLTEDFALSERSGAAGEGQVEAAEQPSDPVLTTAQSVKF